ncbi:MAG: hypothetical protein OEX11_03000 [Nitrosomonas sp.]|nr:hypothetical protein [Nitrosomonas sp.]
MDQAERKRKIIIGSALVVTLIAVVLIEEESDLTEFTQTIQPMQSEKPSSSSLGTREHSAIYIDIDQLGQRNFSAKAGDIFGSTSWAPKRPQISMQQQAVLAQQRAQAKVVPSVPMPPPLQFKYLGKAVEGNKTWVFLAHNDENYVTRIGQNIDDLYRLDTINDEVIILTYLPLDAKQELAIKNEAGNF